MNVNEIVALLDLEIARLGQVKDILASSRRESASERGVPSATRVKRHTLSLAARKKIAAAQRKRWAKARQNTVKAASGTSQAEKPIKFKAASANKPAAAKKKTQMKKSEGRSR